MTHSAMPPYGAPTVTPLDELPMLGTVPLGPDEPELFTDAMGRILDHLNGDAFDAGSRRA